MKAVAYQRNLPINAPRAPKSLSDAQAAALSLTAITGS
jgi:hypothetical protein